MRPEFHDSRFVESATVDSAYVLASEALAWFSRKGIQRKFGVGRATLRRVEGGRRPSAKTFAALKAAALESIACRNERIRSEGGL